MKKEVLDRAVLAPETGVRAVWLLYKRGQWGALEDFGLVRKQAEPALRSFERQETVMNRLTKRQCRRLVQMVPGLAEVSTELRLAYVLKQIDRSSQNGKQILSG